MSTVSGGASMSWNAPPRPTSNDGAVPMSASTGTRLSYASASAGTTFIAPPPPDVVMTTPGVPVIRAVPSAIAPAANSCLATTAVIPPGARVAAS